MALSKAATDIQIKSEQMRGKDAAGAVDFATTEWKKQTEALSESLNNDTQRAAGRRMASSRFDALYKSTNVYAARQLEQYDADSTKSYVDNARNDAVSNYLDPEYIKQSIDRQTASLQDYADRNGKGDDWVKENVTASLSKTHSEIITRMIDNNQDLLAKEYFSHVKDQIAGDDVGKVEKILEAGSIEGESQRTVDDMQSRDLSYKDSMKEAGSIEDPKIRKATEERIQNVFATKEKGDQLQQEAVFKDAFKTVLNSNGLDEIPTSTRLQMSLQENSQLNAYIKQLREGVETPPNGPIFYKYKLMATNPHTRVDFNNTNLLKEAPNMTKTELKELVDIQSKSREKDGSTTDLLDYLYENEKIKRDTMSKVGIQSKGFEWLSPSTWIGGNDEASIVQFNASLDQAIKQKQQAVGRNLTADETQEIANRFATKVVTDRGFIFDNKKPIGALKSEDLSLDAIPIDIRNTISRTLSQKGWPVNEQTIKDAYVRGLKAGVYK